MVKLDSFQKDRYWMRQALELAVFAMEIGEVPVGALLVNEMKVLAKGWNCSIISHDPSAHAEIMALRNAGWIKKNYRFPGSTLYVTLEPCIMCIGAMVHGRVSNLVYGAHDKRIGAVNSVLNIFSKSGVSHNMIVRAGVLEGECKTILKGFFRLRRKK